MESLKWCAFSAKYTSDTSILSLSLFILSIIRAIIYLFHYTSITKFFEVLFANSSGFWWQQIHHYFWRSFFNSLFTRFHNIYLKYVLRNSLINATSFSISTRSIWLPLLIIVTEFSSFMIFTNGTFSFDFSIKILHTCKK